MKSTFCVEHLQYVSISGNKSMNVGLGFVTALLGPKNCATNNIVKWKDFVKLS